MIQMKNERSEKTSVSMKIDSDIKAQFDLNRGELSQVYYLSALILLDNQFGLFAKFGDPTESKFPDDDFAEFLKRVEIIKPLLENLINAEYLQDKVDTILTYLNEIDQASVTPNELDPSGESITSPDVEPATSFVTEGAVDAVQAEAIAIGKQAVVPPGNPSSLLPGNTLLPPPNPHLSYAQAKVAEIGGPEEMRRNQIQEAREEQEERRKILENLGIKGAE